MISLAGVPLALPQGLAAGPDIDLGRVLFSGLNTLPGVGVVPPARPPSAHAYAPGTLRWPQGASRFALGQYLVSDLEAAALWPSGFSTAPLTLTLGGTGTGQDAISFVLRPLTLLPLAVDRSVGVPAGNARAVYLLLLVDGRYFFQTAAPTWTVVEGTTTWDALDAQVLSFLGAGSTASSVPAAYLLPSSGLAPPALASEGVVGWAGPLIDLICLASGRRFVAGTDGTYSLQSWSSADASHAAASTANAGLIAGYDGGGLLAYPPATEGTTGLYVVPAAVACVYPEESGGVPAADRTTTTTFASVRVAAGYAAGDVPSLEGTLRVGMGLWGDGTNGAALDAHAAQWSTDWYAWLRGRALLTYAGCVDFAPDGLTDSITWGCVGASAWTRVERGLLNPRPALEVPGFSGVAPLGPVFPYGAVFLGPVLFYGSTTTWVNETNTSTGTTWNYNSTSVNNYASTDVYTGPQYYPLYDYSGSPFTVNTVDWAIPAGNVRIRIASSSEYLFLGGIIPGASPSGRLLYLYNVGVYTILIPDEYVGEATAARRIKTTDGNFYFLSPGDMVCLAYDATSSRWRVSENTHKRLSKVHTYAAWTTDTDDFAALPEVELHRVSASTDGLAFTGITRPLDSLRHRFILEGDHAVTVAHDTSSVAANRFGLPGGIDYQWVPGQELVYEYDLDASRWRVLGLFPSDTGTVFAYKTTCVAGVNKRYVSAISIENGTLAQTDWVHESDQGCCACGSGSGSGGGTVPTDCCPSNDLPTTLYLTMSSGSGTCSCVDHQTITLAWTGGQVWQGTGSFCSATVGAMLACAGGLWSLGLTGCAGTVAFGSVACNPLLLVGTVTLSNCCAGTAAVVVSEVSP